MDVSNIATGGQLHRVWRACRRVPGGKRAFSRLVGTMAPYTGSIGARVVELRPGFAKVQMRDRRAVRNHLNCVHAIALMNLAEVTTGLAVMTGLADDGRGILKGLEMKYLKKARGTLTAECSCEVPKTAERQNVPILGILRNSDGEVVAEATAHWLIGPKKRN
jgi:acyl-coenzyme A thioesterase PaaI-like protein